MGRSHISQVEWGGGWDADFGFIGWGSVSCISVAVEEILSVVELLAAGGGVEGDERDSCS